MTALQTLPLFAEDAEESPELRKALENLESWLTKPDDFRDVSRGNPRPHTLDEATRKKVGLTRETWQLEVVLDPDNPTQPLLGEAIRRIHRNESVSQLFRQ